MFGLSVLVDHHVCVPLPITRQRWLFCLLVCHGTPFLLRCRCFLSPYPSWHTPSGPAPFYPFWWCVIPAGHFPQKSPGRNLKIGLPLSPPPNHTLLPLTHDFTMSCIGWAQAGEVWVLRVSSFHMRPKSACCSLVCRSLEAYLHSLSFVIWPFMWAVFWFPAPLKGWYLFVTGLYTSFDPFLDCPHFLPYYSVISAVITQSCWASLGLPFILFPSGLTWPLVFLLVGSCVPFCFSLGHPWPIYFLWTFSSLLLTLHSHELLLASLGFPGPITSFSFLGFMGLPLTPYFLCLHYFCLHYFWACIGPFSLFYILYCPWVCYFFLSGLL